MTTPPPPSPARSRHRWVGWVLALLALMAVFLLYSQPAFMLMLADQVWACF